MDSKDLQKLKQNLEKRREEIREQLKDISHEDPAVKGNVEVTMKDYGPTDEDNAQEEADLDRDFALSQQLERELNDIERAIEKIDSGTYGVCSNCTKPIEERRLKAIPVAGLCAVCVKK